MDSDRTQSNFKPMDAHEQAHFNLHIRRYLMVFYALLLGTILTVGVSYVHFGHIYINVAVALFIAVCKASLVAAFFMHLISERHAIYALLGFTAVFFTGLMFLIVWSHFDTPLHTVLH